MRTAESQICGFSVAAGWRENTFTNRTTYSNILSLQGSKPFGLRELNRYVAQ